MARRVAIAGRKEVIPTYPKYDGYKTTTVSVGTTAVALPTTNLSYRKGLFIQNIHASQILYIGGSTIPDIIEAPHLYLKQTGTTTIHDNVWTQGDRKLDWKLSGSGTAEYYATLLSSGGDPGLTQPQLMYGVTSAGGAESLLTNGSIGTLNDHEWVWGNNDTLGYNTIYFRDDSGNPNDNRSFLVLLSYTSMPSTTTAVKITAGNGYSMDLGGNARAWGIANLTGTTTVVKEFF